MRVPLALKTARIRNFKAIRDSGTIKFTPLTVFIGNNGSGKSSVVEGLETLQRIARNGKYRMGRNADDGDLKGDGE